METRPGCRVHAIIVTSCHGNDDEAWSTSCLIMQHKPYIVELSFMDTQKSHDSINEGPPLTTEGPPQTNVVHVPMSHLGQNLSMIFNYTPYPCHLSCSFALLHQLAYFCVVIVAFEGTRWWLLNNIGLVLHNQA